MFPPADGCRTYRKSLRGQRNGRSEAEAQRMRIRARQQRVSKSWQLFIPSMASIL